LDSLLAFAAALTVVVQEEKISSLFFFSLRPQEVDLSAILTCCSIFVL
jgi:hypothetical protein